jgi:hypothetical protein
MPKYRYSAKAGQEHGQGGLLVKLYTNDPNTDPVISVKAFVTQLDQKDVTPVLDLKCSILSDSDDPSYPIMHKEAVILVESIQKEFQAGKHNPTSLIMLVHPALTNGIAGAI